MHYTGETTMQQVVEQMADEKGDIQLEQTESVQPELDFDINIRDDQLRLFESDNGQMFLKAEQMPENVYAEVIPTSEGPVAEIVAGVQTELEECTPAERAEQPDVDTSVDSTVIVD